MTYRIETRGGGGGGDSGGGAEETVLVDDKGNFVTNLQIGDDGRYNAILGGGGDSGSSYGGGSFTLEDILNQSKSEKDVAFGTGRGQALGYAYELRNEDDEPYQRYDAQGNLTEFLNRVSGEWNKASDVKPIGTVFDPTQGKMVTQYQFGDNKFTTTPGGPMGTSFAPVLEAYSKDTSGWLGEGGWAKIGMRVAAAASAGLAGAAAGAGGVGSAAAGAGAGAGAGVGVGSAAATVNAAESILNLTNLLGSGSTLATAADIAGQVVRMGTTAYDLLKDEHPEAAAVVKKLQDDVKTQTNAGESFDTAVTNAVNTTSGASDADIRNVYRDVFGQEVTDEWLATQRATGLDKDTLANAYQGWEDADIRAAYRDVFGQEVTDEWLATQRASNLGKEGFTKAYQGWEDEAATKQLPPPVVEQPPPVVEPPVVEPPVVEPPVVEPPVVEPPVVEPPVVEPPVVEPPVDETEVEADEVDPIARPLINELTTRVERYQAEGKSRDDAINQAIADLSASSGKSIADLTDLVTTGDQDLMDALGETTTTLTDLIGGVSTGLGGQITAVRDDLTGQITGVEDNLTGQITDVRTDLGGQITDVGGQVTDLTTDFGDYRTEQEKKQEEQEKEKRGKEAVDLLSQMATTTVKTPEVAKIEYMYDIGGDSLFATPKQESLMPSPFEDAPDPVEGAMPRYQYYAPGGGYTYAEGGLIGNDDLQTIDDLYEMIRGK